MIILSQLILRLFLMINSLRYRLILWFLLSAFLLFVLSFALFWVHKSNKTNHQATLEDLQYFRYQFLKDQYQVAEFLSSEINDQNFYITGESKYLNSHYNLIDNIDSCFTHSFKSDRELFPQLKKSLFDVKENYTAYCSLFDSLTYNIYKRGYKNLGLEGEITTHYYQLEKSGTFPAGILKDIKLIESNYLHNYDPYLLYEVDKQCDILIEQVKYNPFYTQPEKNKYTSLITAYSKSFRKLVNLDKKIGLSQSAGLKQNLILAGNKLESSINKSIVQAQQGFDAYMGKLNLIFALTAFLLVALAFGVSLYTSRYLVSHLERLSAYISAFSKNNFDHKIDVDLRHSTREIRHIYREFRNMFAELRIREKQRDMAVRSAEDNEKRYRDLADLLPQSIFETDRTGQLTYVNQEWYNTFGYTPDDIVNGVNLSNIIKMDPNVNLMGISRFENNDMIAVRKDGTQFSATIYSDIIKKGLRIIGRRGIINDSTLRNLYIESLKKETMKAIASDQHKSSFLANMSHEIRTPMNSIIGFSNMLTSDEIPQDQKKEFITHIQTSSEMLLNLIDDIIDIAKIEAGQLKIKKAECNPVKLIRDLEVSISAYKNRLEKEHIEIRHNLPEEEIPFITDDFRVKQILTNLLGNAIKFTESGWIEIGFRKKNQRILEFYVEDTGIGMGKEELRDVFERFTRSKISEEKKISGTGLGLSISKNLVELLGGTMWVTSKPGKGSKFTFELPYIRVVNPAKIEEPALPQNIYDFKNLTILIAEDDDNSYTYLSQIFLNVNAQTIRAVNGKEAIEAINFHEKIDLILMDIQMPLVNGLEATTRIKEKHPHLPVIAQTAFALEGDRDRFIAAGCDDYITKPIDAQKILAKAAQFIGNTVSDSSKQPDISTFSSIGNSDVTYSPNKLN